MSSTAELASPADTPALRGARRSGGKGSNTRLRLPGFLRPIGTVWLLLLILVAWEIFARLSPTIFFPPLSDVVVQFRNDWLTKDPTSLFLSQQFWDSVPVSLGRLAGGWLLAAVVGILFGAVLGRSPLMSAMYQPIVRFFMAVPNAALLPIAFQIFGAHSSMNIFLIFAGTVWLVIINTADGMSGVDPQWVRSARSLHLSKFALYRQVLLPAASPSIMAGLRVSLSIGLILMIVSELYATTSGLGFDVMLYQQSFRYHQMWSSFVLIALIGVVLNMGMNVIEKRMLRWQRRSGLGDL